jgi:hypothetical protein
MDFFASNKKWVAVGVVIITAAVLQWAGFPVTNIFTWVPGLFGGVTPTP